MLWRHIPAHHHNIPVGYIWGYPGTYPSITNIALFGTRVPQVEAPECVIGYILCGYPSTYPSITKITC